MSWQSIDNVKPAQVKADSVPADGVKVTPRALRARGSGETTRWINIEIGADLARKLSLVQESVKVRLLMGGGTDAGKIAVSVDATAGNFLAKRKKRGSYYIALNAKSADGLFRLQFEPFLLRKVEAIRPVNGQPPMCVIAAPSGFLAGRDA